MALKNKTHDPQRLAIQRKPKPVARIENDQDVSHRPGSLERILAKSPATLRPADVLTLQRTVGNRAVQRMLSNQPYSPSSLSSTSPQTIQRQTEEEEPLQAKFDVVQRVAYERGKLVQDKFNLVERQDQPEEAEEPLQGKFETSGVIQRFPVTATYGPVQPRRGGTSMTAKVGAASEWRRGSPPPGDVPTLINEVGAFHQGRQRYIAGHLLNQNMGGEGENRNLTVLTSSANAAHRGVEGMVKYLAQRADSINNYGASPLGNSNYDHGARYTVRVLSPQPDGTYPYGQAEERIGRGLEIDINPIRIHKVTGRELTWWKAVLAGYRLTRHVIPNVPPYPRVPGEKKLTPIQRAIVVAISGEEEGSSVQTIMKKLQAQPSFQSRRHAPSRPTETGVRLALKRGVSSKFFSRRDVTYKVIRKNLQ